MKRLNRFLSFCALTIIPVIAYGHAGHDGHELVWEMAGTHVHLDWVLGTLLIAGALVGVYRYVRKRG